jgi:putative ABC transport system substrate-binding protein
VGVLASSSEANFGPNVDIIREALRAAGWVEGRNLTLDVRYPGEHYATLPELAAELVRRRVDVLVCLGTPATLVAKGATTTVPIVMESLSDVVSTGLVSSLARPGGNVTGVSSFAPELMGKRHELIRGMLPRADDIAVLVNQSNPVTASILRATEAAGRQIGMKLCVIDVRRPAELAAAFETASTLRRDRRPRLLRSAPSRAVPADRRLRGPHPAGGSAGRAARRAADHVRAGDQSQDGQGARPDDPPSLRQRADQVIE